MLADRAGLGNSFKRARGWAASTEAVMARAKAEPGLSAIALDDRFLFNAMQYYGRDELSRPGAPPLRMNRPKRPKSRRAMPARLPPISCPPADSSV